jgi:hypothetical protein
MSDLTIKVVVGKTKAGERMVSGLVGGVEVITIHGGAIQSLYKLSDKLTYAEAMAEAYGRAIAEYSRVA